MTVTTGAREELLEQVGSSLRGSRRRRRRLLAELDEHLHDALSAELAQRLDEEAAACEVLARFGTAAEISARWNADERKRRATRRRHYAALAFAAVTATGLGITQYASGKTSPPPPRCTATASQAARSPAERNCKPRNEVRRIRSRPSTGHR
jgi:hypothetical protein